MFHDEVNELAVLKYLRTTRCLQTLPPTRSYWRTLASDTTSSGGLHWQDWPVTLLPLVVCIGNINQWCCFIWRSALATLASDAASSDYLHWRHWPAPTLKRWSLPWMLGASQKSKFAWLQIVAVIVLQQFIRLKSIWHFAQEITQSVQYSIFSLQHNYLRVCYK